MLNPFKMDRCKPGIVDLFWDLPLYICQGVLPFACDGHNLLCYSSYTGLFTPVYNLVFRASFFVSIMHGRHFDRLMVTKVIQITTDYGPSIQWLPRILP